LVIGYWLLVIGSAESGGTGSGGGVGSGSEIHTLNVTVLKECTKYPYLEMDESCKY